TTTRTTWRFQVRGAHRGQGDRGRAAAGRALHAQLPQAPAGRAADAPRHGGRGPGLLQEPGAAAGRAAGGAGPGGAGVQHGDLGVRQGGDGGPGARRPPPGR
ncbi:unnamed protein product, partial [Heterosigma akashiwo]